MRRRPSPAFAAPFGEPISELNTTPLIDVMLVLLIMFIITIPIATHKVPLTLPGGVPPPVAAEPVVHLLDMDVAGRVYWNGALTPEARLPGLLAEMRASGPLAVLHFLPIFRIRAAQAAAARQRAIDLERFTAVRGGGAA